MHTVENVAQSVLSIRYLLSLSQLLTSLCLIFSFNILLLPSQVPNAYRQLTIGRKSLPQRHSQVEKRKDIFWGKIVDVSLIGERVGEKGASCHLADTTRDARQC